MIIDFGGWVGIGNQSGGNTKPLTILDISCGDGATGDLSGSSGLIIPRGNTSTRPISGTEANSVTNPYLGCIRYNEEISSFEGFGAGNSWGTLGE